MLSTIIFNFFASIIAVSVSGTIVLHDTRLDKAFISTVAPASDTALRDFSHSMSSDMHAHSHDSISGASLSDPLLANRSHRKHISVPIERLRLSAFSA